MQDVDVGGECWSCRRRAQLGVARSASVIIRTAINQRKGINMLRDLGWSFYSILALVCGVTTAWLHWWVVMHEGLWPYIIFELIPGLPGAASGVYAIHRDGSKAAWAGVLLSLSPLATWLSI